MIKKYFGVKIYTCAKLKYYIQHEDFLSVGVG